MRIQVNERVFVTPSTPRIKHAEESSRVAEYDVHIIEMTQSKYAVCIESGISLNGINGCAENCREKLRACASERPGLDHMFNGYGLCKIPHNLLPFPLPVKWSAPGRPQRWPD